MTPEEIQLNKPLWEAGSGGRAQPPREKKPAAPAPRTPPPVFGGFWVRLMALTVDLLTIIIAHNLLAAVGLDEIFYQIAAWCPLLGLLAMFAMLVVVPTRIWPGQTLGKRLLKLRVVTQEFEDPPLGMHLQRFVIIAAIFLPGWLMSGPLPLRETLIQNPLPMGLFQGIVFGLILTQISLFIMHPAKRGFHDLWARTYVVRLDSPDPHPAHALSAMDERAQLRMRQARRMAYLMFPLLVVVFGIQLGREQESPLAELRRDVRDRLVELAGPTSMVGHQAVPFGASPEAWVLIVQMPNRFEMPWDEVEESPAARDLADRALDLAERDYDLASLPDEPLADLPLAGSVAVITEDYTVIPGLAQLGRFAGGQRAALWNRQYRPMEGLDDGLLPGTQLIPFSPSPEATAAEVTPEAAATDGAGQ